MPKNTTPDDELEVSEESVSEELEDVTEDIEDEGEIEIEDPEEEFDDIEPAVLEEQETPEQPATPAAKTNIFRPGIEGVTAEHTTRAQAESAILDMNMTLDAIQSAIHNGQVLVNTATAVLPLRLSGREVCCLSFSYASGVRVIIPYDSVFEEAPYGTVGDTTKMSAKNAHDLLIRQRTVLSGMLGGPIRWIPVQIVPTSASGNEYTVVGSRVMALREDRERLYFAKTPTFRDRHTYFASVTCVLSHMAMINLGGVEKMIPQASLTYQYARDLRDIFKPGDEVHIVLKELVCDKDTGDINCLFDCLSGELMDAQPQVKQLIRGMVTRAVISRVATVKDRNTGTPGTLMLGWITAPGVPCKCNSGYRSLHEIPIGPGVEVVVKVQSIGADGCPRVVINRVIGPVN